MNWRKSKHWANPAKSVTMVLNANIAHKEAFDQRYIRIAATLSKKACYVIDDFCTCLTGTLRKTLQKSPSIINRQALSKTFILKIEHQLSIKACSFTTMPYLIKRKSWKADEESAYKCQELFWPLHISDLLLQRAPDQRLGSTQTFLPTASNRGNHRHLYIKVDSKRCLWPLAAPIRSR